MRKENPTALVVGVCQVWFFYLKTQFGSRNRAFYEKSGFFGVCVVVSGSERLLIMRAAYRFPSLNRAIAPRSASSALA